MESYTAALTLNIESRPFTAICFCNRAAAYQALGQITDAIADCSLAIALDTSYAKVGVLLGGLFYFIFFNIYIYIYISIVCPARQFIPFLNVNHHRVICPQC